MSDDEDDEGSIRLDDPFPDDTDSDGEYSQSPEPAYVDITQDNGYDTDLEMDDEG